MFKKTADLVTGGTPNWVYQMLQGVFVPHKNPTFGVCKKRERQNKDISHGVELNFMIQGKFVWVLVTQGYLVREKVPVFWKEEIII